MGLDIYLLSTIYPIISSYNISTDQAVREFLWCEERIYPITYAIWSDKSVLNAQNFIGVQVFILLLRSDIFNRVHIISKGWIPLENGSHSDARKIGIQRQNLILFITTVYDFNGSISMNIEIPAAQVAIFLAFFDASTLKLHWKLSIGPFQLYVSQNFQWKSFKIKFQTWAIADQDTKSNFRRTQYCIRYTDYHKQNFLRSNADDSYPMSISDAVYWS